MSVQTDLEARTAQLAAILEESNEALEEKGGAPADNLREIPACIRDLDDGVELDVLEIEPTGEKIVVDAEEGRAFRRVIVAAAGGGSDYPVLVLPEEYLAYVEYARENLYTGDFANLVVWESVDWIAVSFLMSDFTINSYDLYSTELTATGWVTCGYTKSTGEWTTHDYRSSESPGGNYARYIVFASCRVKYGNQILFPVGVTETIKLNSVTYDDDAGTVTLVYATGQTEVLTWVKDDSGNITGVTDSQGHTTSLWEVST